MWRQAETGMKRPPPTMEAREEAWYLWKGPVLPTA